MRGHRHLRGRGGVAVEHLAARLDAGGLEGVDRGAHALEGGGALLLGLVRPARAGEAHRVEQDDGDRLLVRALAQGGDQAVGAEGVVGHDGDRGRRPRCSSGRRASSGSTTTRVMPRPVALRRRSTTSSAIQRERPVG